jgi:hypothetical protein
MEDLTPELNPGDIRLKQFGRFHILFFELDVR